MGEKFENRDFSQKCASAKKTSREKVLNAAFSRLGAAAEQKGDRLEHFRQGNPLAGVRIRLLGVDFHQIRAGSAKIFTSFVLQSLQIRVIFCLSLAETFAEAHFCEIHRWAGLRPEPPDFPKFSFQ